LLGVSLRQVLRRHGDLTIHTHTTGFDFAQNIVGLAGLFFAISLKPGPTIFLSTPWQAVQLCLFKTLMV
jgi:hypothetical protein